MSTERFAALNPSTNIAIVSAALVLSVGSMAAIARVDPTGKTCAHISSDASALTCRAALWIGNGANTLAAAATRVATGRAEASHDKLNSGA